MLGCLSGKIRSFLRAGVSLGDQPVAGDGGAFSSPSLVGRPGSTVSPTRQHLPACETECPHPPRDFPRGRSGLDDAATGGRSCWSFIVGALLIGRDQAQSAGPLENLVPGGAGELAVDRLRVRMDRAV